MKRTFAVLAVTGLLFLSHSLQNAARAESENLAAPKGLIPCASNDPVNASGPRIAASVNGQFLSCFQSEEKTDVLGAPDVAPVPVEYAFAISLASEVYTTTDLDKLLTTVTAQWKGFQPLSTEFHDNYIARINALINSGHETPVAIASIKPVLISIDRLDVNSYSVVSIRSYVFNVNGTQVSMTKVNADAVVLRGRRFIRLTMQRMLTNASDVTRLQTEISEWARATESAKSE